MKSTLFIIFALPIVVSLLLPSSSAFASTHEPSKRAIDPIVSTGWLKTNMALPDLVVLDIRSADAYAAGHIPNSVSAPFPDPFHTKWAVSDPKGLWLELPKKSDLFAMIGGLGIKSQSRVVIVTAPSSHPNPPYYGLADGTRVADTLIYAGVKNVAILDGGYPKWVGDKMPVSTDAPNMTPVAYDGEVNPDMFVAIDYVRGRIGKAIIVDARDPEMYFGATVDFFSGKEGHVPSARSLPTPWIWKMNPDDKTYIYQDKAKLSAMAAGVIARHGKAKNKEAIVYCGVGGYAASWWFVLTQVLGYENVKIFDGSIQEWGMKNQDMVSYRWE
jgi:thiosulfate/3-mercaptopyruvate sulfurtransferase